MVDGRDRVMHIDQFDLSFCGGLRWLADRDAFADAVRDVHGRGGAVQAYVGSPLVVRQTPQAEYLPKCAPGSKSLSSQLRLLGRVSGCRSPLRPCVCWDRLVRFHVGPLVDAGVDAIGFDDSADFHPGGCMDRLVRSLLTRRFEVQIEAWPRAKRAYPPVSWIIREVHYQRIRLEPKPDEARADAIHGRLYRIVPADTAAGRAELEEINRIRRRHGEPPFGSLQEIVDAVRSDGHIPMVRSNELSRGAVA